MEMIERVAHAICDATNDEITLIVARHAARQAIKAMREPRRVTFKLSYDDFEMEVSGQPEPGQHMAVVAYLFESFSASVRRMVEAGQLAPPAVATDPANKT